MIERNVAKLRLSNNHAYLYHDEHNLQCSNAVIWLETLFYDVCESPSAQKSDGPIPSTIFVN